VDIIEGGQAVAQRAALTVGRVTLALESDASVVDDAALAAFAASVELSAVEMYTASAARMTGPAVLLAQAFAVHHREHARTFNAFAGINQVTTANARLTAAIQNQLDASADQRSRLMLAFQLENQLASTHQSLLGKFTSPGAVRLGASILPVESEHAVILGTFLGLDLEKDLIPFTLQPTAGPPTHPEWGSLDPARYPVGG
jgi:rubrerythrin